MFIKILLKLKIYYDNEKDRIPKGAKCGGDRKRLDAAYFPRISYKRDVR